MRYSFRDDYSDGAHPEILEHIVAHNDGQQRTYGEDEYCLRAEEQIRLFFGLPEAAVYFVPSGTLANTICLDAMLIYIDGARLAMSLGSPLATMKPKEFGSLQIDAFSVGGTKNGGLYGEAIVVGNSTLQPFFKTYMKQQGAVLGKGRFLGLQFERFFADDNLWLNLAKKTTAKAAQLPSCVLSFLSMEQFSILAQEVTSCSR